MAPEVDEVGVSSEILFNNHDSSARFLDRDGLDGIDCDRSEVFFVQRLWQVAIVDNDGKVVEVLANTGLIGP